MCKNNFDEDIKGHARKKGLFRIIEKIDDFLHKDERKWEQYVEEAEISDLFGSWMTFCIENTYKNRKENYTAEELHVI